MYLGITDKGLVHGSKNLYSYACTFVLLLEINCAQCQNEMATIIMCKKVLRNN